MLLTLFDQVRWFVIEFGSRVLFQLLVLLLGISLPPFSFCYRQTRVVACKGCILKSSCSFDMSKFLPEIINEQLFLSRFKSTISCTRFLNLLQYTYALKQHSYMNVQVCSYVMSDRYVSRIKHETQGRAAPEGECFIRDTHRNQT